MPTKFKMFLLFIVVFNIMFLRLKEVSKMAAEAGVKFKKLRGFWNSEIVKRLAISLILCIPGGIVCTVDFFLLRINVFETQGISTGIIHTVLWMSAGAIIGGNFPFK